MDSSMRVPGGVVPGGVAAWLLAGLCFALYPAMRPVGDSVAAWGSPWWTPAHLLGVAGFALLVVGTVAVWWTGVATGGGRGARAGGVAAVAAGAGLVPVVAYYGVETFGLAALGRAVLDGADPALLAVSDAMRFGPAAAVLFATGLALVAVAGVSLAVASAADTPRWAGWAVAVGLVTYLPQFLASPGVRIAHGVLLGVGCVGMAVVVTRRAARSQVPSGAGGR